MEILNYVRAHENWENELVSRPYNLKITRDGEYIMFKYNQIASDFSIPLVREARGIIFHEPTWECVCHAMDKFGNYGEAYCPDIDWNTASVQEKIDGSLIKLWYHNGKWHFSTNNTIDAAKAQLGDVKYHTFMDLINEVFPYDVLEMLDSSFTYWFELVSPYNRVVIPYEEIKMYFLGWRNMVTSKEMYPRDSIVCWTAFDTPKRYFLGTLEDVQYAASELGWDEEGFVVCDGHFNRVKIKSPEYVKAHYTRNNNVMTTKRLIDILLSGEEAEFLIYANEYKEQLEDVKAKTSLVYQELLKAMATTLMWKDKPIKESAQKVLAEPKYVQPLMFNCYRHNMSVEQYISDWSAEKWAEVIAQL